MNPIYFLRPKGVVTLLFGLLILLAPAWFMTLMGAQVGPAAEVMIRLFGLALMVVGYGMATTPKDAEIDPREALLTVFPEFTAVYFLVTATQAGAFNVLGYALASVYVVSGLGFFFCYLAASKACKNEVQSLE